MREHKTIRLQSFKASYIRFFLASIFPHSFDFLASNNGKIRKKKKNLMATYHYVQQQDPKEPKIAHATLDLTEYSITGSNCE